MANPTTTKNSPLYTPKAQAEAKATAVRRMGPDSDGAYRATGRKDGQS